MAVKRVFFIAAFVAILTTGMPWAMAGDNQTAVKETGDTPKKAEIIVDEENGVVRILIEGKEKAFIDAGGLHVDGNITYSGSITDIGEQSTEGNKP